MEREVVNTYEQMTSAGGDRVAIMPYHWQGTREWYRDGWSVHHIIDGKWKATDKTNNHNSFANGYLCKLFERTGDGDHRAQDKAALVAAIAWCDARYGKREYVRNRMGCYVEKEVNDKYPIRRSTRA